MWIGAPSPGRSPAPLTMPRRASIAPGGADADPCQLARLDAGRITHLLQSCGERRDDGVGVALRGGGLLRVGHDAAAAVEQDGLDLGAAEIEAADKAAAAASGTHGPIVPHRLDGRVFRSSARGGRGCSTGTPRGRQARGMTTPVLEPVRPEHAERLRELRATPEVAHWWDPAPEGWPLEPEARSLPVHDPARRRGGGVHAVLRGARPGLPARRRRHLPRAPVTRGAASAARRCGRSSASDRRARPPPRHALHRARQRPRDPRYEKVGFRGVGVLRKARLRPRERRVGRRASDGATSSVESTPAREPSPVALGAVVLGVDVGGTRSPWRRSTAWSSSDAVEQPTELTGDGGAARRDRGSRCAR